MNTKVSKIWEIGKEEFAEIIKNSKTFSDAVRTIKEKFSSVSYVTMRKRIDCENVDITHILNYVKEMKYLNNEKIPLEQILTENSYQSQNHLKKRLLTEKLLDYKCSVCGNVGEWLGKKLSLHMDHINGKHHDNRLENLRMLCPNCHSQTETYTGKNLRKKPKPVCSICGKTISRGSKMCRECNYKTNPQRAIRNRKWEATKEELEKLLSELPMTKIGEKFGVSANAVKRRMKTLGIVITDKRGFWSKFYSEKLKKEKILPTGIEPA